MERPPFVHMIPKLKLSFSLKIYRFSTVLWITNAKASKIEVCTANIGIDPDNLLQNSDKLYKHIRITRTESFAVFHFGLNVE